MKDHTGRRYAVAAAISLLLMAILAPFAQFGVLAQLVVPADAAATARNIAGSPALFGAAGAMFFIVAVLDVVVAWGLYRLFSRIDRRLARFVGWSRVVYTAGFAIALTNIAQVSSIVAAGPAGGTPSAELAERIASSIAAFNGTWDLALIVFGAHLVGLGALLWKSVDIPRFLSAFVTLAGIGYLTDALGRTFVPGYALTISTFTFIGEALLIVWLFKIAIKGRVAGDGIRSSGAPDKKAPTDAVGRGRSPVPAILGSLVVGAALAVVLAFAVVSDASEALLTGSVLLAYGIGWGLMAFMTRRFSDQPQAWARIPAAVLGSIGLGLVVLQPGPSVMDLLAWVWPPAIAVLAIWTFQQVRHQLRGRGPWLVAPVVAALLLMAIGGAVTTVGTVGTSAVLAGEGRLIDVGGHRLYIECSGSGGPVVLLQAGMGASSSSWAAVAPEVAATTTVCAYDRAGHGRSDEAGSQDGIALATDLHVLLERAGIPGPYVLVAHSSGGPYVEVFAQRYPNDVAGMVLLDPQPADVFTSVSAYPSIYRSLHLVAHLSPTLARVGLLGPVVGLPANEATVALARGARDEIDALPAALNQANVLTTIGDRPLVLVTAVAESMAGWLEAHDAMVGLSTNAAHRVLAAATHNSLISGADTGASIQAVLDVLAAVRDGTTLR